MGREEQRLEAPDQKPTDYSDHCVKQFDVVDGELEYLLQSLERGKSGQ